MADEILMDCVDACRVAGKVDIGDYDPRETFGWVKKPAKERFREEVAHVHQLHKRLFAERTTAVLLVLQGIDAGGKGGTIRSVLSQLNPAAVAVHPFKAPTDEELLHDYLWRVHAVTPERGTIGVFDRSHYEDVLVVRVRHLVPEEVWRRRYGHIRNFETELSDEGTVVVKIYLNVSKEEQRARLQDRIDSPDEQWKFRAGDLEDRALWDQYRVAYNDALSETSVEHAPWYIVPGDRKWVRNLTVAKILRHHLIEIDPHYPPADEPVDGIIVE